MEVGKKRLKYDALHNEKKRKIMIEKQLHINVDNNATRRGAFLREATTVEPIEKKLQDQNRRTIGTHHIHDEI